MKVNWDDEIPSIWENKKWQPNHQPDIEAPQIHRKKAPFLTLETTAAPRDSTPVFFIQVTTAWIFGRSSGVESTLRPALVWRCLDGVESHAEIVI